MDLYFQSQKKQESTADTAKKEPFYVINKTESAMTIQSFSMWSVALGATIFCTLKAIQKFCSGYVKAVENAKTIPQVKDEDAQKSSNLTDKAIEKFSPGFVSNIQVGVKGGFKEAIGWLVGTLISFIGLSAASENMVPNTFYEPTKIVISGIASVAYVFVSVVKTIVHFIPGVKG